MIVARTSVKRNPPFTGNKEAGDAFRLWISRAELRTWGLSISVYAWLVPGMTEKTRFAPLLAHDGL